MPEPAPKIFISYAWKNQAMAKRLQSDLQRDGVEVFVDYEKISGGDSLPERISAALDWCNTLVLLWSADSAESYYVKQEWSSAFHLQKKIIACVLDVTKLPALLSGNRYLNFSLYETGYAELCRSLGVEPKVIVAPPAEKRETPLPVTPKRKSITDTFRRKLKPSDPAPVLKPPEVFGDVKHDEANAAEIAMSSRWLSRKTLVALLVVAAILLTANLLCHNSTNLTQTAPRFRDKPDTLSSQDVKALLRDNDFYSRDYGWNNEFSNPQGRGFENNLT